MATNKRNIIDYLPPFMQVFLEMRQIMTAEQGEFDALWAACEDTMSDQFILYATENGVKRWEALTGITPKDTDTLEERKFRVVTRLNQNLPYTLTKLQESLTAICGAGNFSIESAFSEYHIEIKLALSNAKNYQEVTDLLTKMLPANLTQHVQIMYNSHTVLTQFTHEQLQQYTNNQLRNEVF